MLNIFKQATIIFGSFDLVLIWCRYTAISVNIDITSRVGSALRIMEGSPEGHASGVRWLRVNTGGRRQIRVCLQTLG